jgi:hypothetical protein
MARLRTNASRAERIHAHPATDPLLGSLTILPMLLLRNPCRANGGLFARAYPFFRMFGIDTVTLIPK